MAKYPICATVNDTREASLIIARMFLDIIKTPDLTCYVENTSGEKQGKKELVNLETEFNQKLRFTMDHAPLGCFDSQVLKHFEENNQKVLAQGGKYLNSIKEINPLYSEYSSDIAIRGNFQDKLLAIQYLVTRYLGILSTEDRQGSLLDIESVANETVNYFSHIILGEKLENPVPFVDASGNKVVVDYALSHDLIIPEQPTNLVIKYFGLPENSNVEFNRKAIDVAKKFSKSTDFENRARAKSFEDLLSVGVFKSIVPIADATNNGVSIAEIDGDTFVADKSNLFAKTMIDSMNAQNLLKSVNKESIQKILRMKNKDFDFPAEFGDAEKTAAKLPGKFLAQLISLKSKNAKLTVEILTPQVGADLAAKIVLAYGLSIEQMKNIAAFVEVNSALSENASAEEKKIFAVAPKVLQDFVDGILNSKNNSYMRSLDIMAPLK
jgi:hypothetical protein